MTIAVFDGTQAVSWAQIDAVEGEVARRFSSEGSVPSLPVNFEASKTIETSVFVLAALGARVPVVPVLPAWSARDRQARLKAVPERIDLGEEELHALVHDALARSVDRPRHRLQLSESPAALLFTSGTSGPPKAVALAGRSLEASARASQARLRLAEGDALVTNLSFAHVGGLSILSRALVNRHRVFVFDARSPEALVRALLAAEAKAASLVPTMLSDLLDDSATVERLRSAGTLRAFIVGGAHTPDRLVERARVAGIPLRLTYGLTEASSQVTLQTEEEAGRNDGNVGSPLEGITVRILDERGLPLGRGESGRIHVSGPSMALGYVGGASFEHGFLTQDSGFVDELGALHVTGRVDDVIVSGGHKIAPRTIEDALRSCEGVREVVAFGLADDRLGSAIALVVARARTPHVAIEDALRSIRERVLGVLSPPYRPRYVTIVDELPPAAGTFDKPRRSLLESIFAPTLEPL